jgi:hypothetical protein
MFSDAEIAFLIRPHRVETADRHTRSLDGVVDLRKLGCPSGIFNLVLESRARRLGPKFAEFRRQQRPPRGGATTQDDLTQRVQASKLF